MGSAVLVLDAAGAIRRQLENDPAEKGKLLSEGLSHLQIRCVTSGGFHCFAEYSEAVVRPASVNLQKGPRPPFTICGL